MVGNDGNIIIVINFLYRPKTIDYWIMALEK